MIRADRAQIHEARAEGYGDAAIADLEILNVALGLEHERSRRTSTSSTVMRSRPGRLRCLGALKAARTGTT